MLWLLLLGPTTLQADNQTVAVASDDLQPAVSIIIDDLGNQQGSGLRAINLPGPITYAILPHRPFTRLLARYAHGQNKEVMIHVPMEAESGAALGPGGLLSDMAEKQFKTEVRHNFEAVPHAVGFNNHMGSRLTASTSRMRWLMQAAMFRDDLYFIDSRTTRYTVAEQQASQRRIRNTSRDIFLDYQGDDAQVVAEQLTKLIQRAWRDGTALAIGHPYPATLDTLGAWLPVLQEHGVRLVPVSELIELRQQRRDSTWPMYSSRSPRVAKSSKP
ncbi:divergent polysaccharide deacetylase family protein [Thiohalophilus sp.]|uniref:divergent polysaccharide deacetylase family protein n=1 Tax=Thiohalophilus sp. TaxID=3028392 RepID=UPI003974B9EB